MRIQRALARAGVASRRQAELLIAEGRVSVNGVKARTGQTVDPDKDAISVDGRAVSRVTGTSWFLLNKPAGVLTTRRDPGGRKTVFDLVPEVPGLTYVGRLDYLTEGALLFTTDGGAAHRLTHPSSEVERRYVAHVRGNAPEAVRAARRGIELDDGVVRPLEISCRAAGGRSWELELALAEGKNREVRRVCEALGLEVLRLVRISFGPIVLGKLASGACRPLTTRERHLVDAL